MQFASEAAFEKTLIEALFKKGWSDKVLEYPTEKDLIANWAKILFENNRGIDRLNGVPLSDGEMRQILDQISTLRTPLKLNGFINGKTVTIRRDNPEDLLHYGKEISLKIYDRYEISGGQSRYQIAKQPIFKTRSNILNDRRGDFILLINGMPFIHVELKNSNIPVSQACRQIEKYAHEGVFSGIFSLVQVFVAMTPTEMVYFANPGPDGKFNKDYYFHWADFNNEPINQWHRLAELFLAIPMAHQLIGFYTVADDNDGVLKIMRSYQYYATNRISDKVAKTKWDEKHLLGGYIWHTTGSGKTMTSFKSAQLIANSGTADKVIFLVDRIELGTQSFEHYKGFAEDSDDVQNTEDTHALIAKLKSDNPANILIVTSIQKMSNVKLAEHGLNEDDISNINAKRIVFIVDEAHRSTFGDMLITIKQTFNNAIFFGFTGTPIQQENQKKNNTTATVFGNELHRYSIADGIRDGNVLGFDPYKINTYKDRDLRTKVALKQANAATETEAIADPTKKQVYYHYMNDVKMAGYYNDAGKYVKGIEDYVKRSQYNRAEHRQMVLKDIAENWLRLSHNGKFHAILATSSIEEAIAYYRLFKQTQPQLKVTALFDANIDNCEGAISKEDGLVEIIEDYNARYQQAFTLATHAKLKKDIAARLAHKGAYQRIENDVTKQLDILIVVDQMLTGYDSKWVNTLYLDKVLKYQNIIQAFSRTNRLFGPDKPFGTIRYYRYPNTMQKNIEAAVELYSGNRQFGLFVEHLPFNLNKMNQVYFDIKRVFELESIENFNKLPDEIAARGEFAKLFGKFNDHLEAAKIQGFTWQKVIYQFDEDVIEMAIDEQTYLTLVQRYKELPRTGGEEGAGGSNGDDVPFIIDSYLIEIDTEKIDNDYMNLRFSKYIKVLNQPNVDEAELKKMLDELHKSFARLSQEQQKYANIFLHDVQSGDIVVSGNKTFRDYIAEYQLAAENKQIATVATALGLDIDQLRTILNANLTTANINEYGRFDNLKASVDMSKAKAYLESKTGKTMSLFAAKQEVTKLLRQFIIDGVFKYETSSEDIQYQNDFEYQTDIVMADRAAE